MLSKIIIISVMILLGLVTIFGIIMVHPDIFLIISTIGITVTGICAFMALTCDYKD